MNTPYDKAYFIAKFEAIEECKWISGTFDDGERCCALGHADSWGPEAGALTALFGEWRAGMGYLSNPVVVINDGRDPRFQQPTPKQRILAALRSLP